MYGKIILTLLLLVMPSIYGQKFSYIPSEDAIDVPLCIKAPEFVYTTGEFLWAKTYLKLTDKTAAVSVKIKWQHFYNEYTFYTEPLLGKLRLLYSNGAGKKEIILTKEDYISESVLVPLEVRISGSSVIFSIKGRHIFTEKSTYKSTAGQIHIVNLGIRGLAAYEWVYKGNPEGKANSND